MQVTANELVQALTMAMGRDEDQELDDYLIDNLAIAIATLLAVLEEILKVTKNDERVLL
ncbi:hypothetical protein LCGC14_1813290 [marine sediment metagenome]|uniref:Uncharacterized protein n=1 Tax=marine sediment metagenome TaxID=412755 RepID=A0A0F9H964_9ZZZZ